MTFTNQHWHPHLLTSISSAIFTHVIMFLFQFSFSIKKVKSISMRFINQHFSKLFKSKLSIHIPGEGNTFLKTSISKSLHVIFFIFCRNKLTHKSTPLKNCINAPEHVFIHAKTHKNQCTNFDPLWTSTGQHKPLHLYLQQLQFQNPQVNLRKLYVMIPFDIVLLLLLLW